MVVLLNGAVGYWDELAIAFVALAVLWIAVRLAGRNPAKDDDEDDDDEETSTEGQTQHEVTRETDDTPHQPRTSESESDVEKRG